MGTFPSHYCAFECIVLLRMVFFFLFNVINAYSLCVQVNETKLRIYKVKHSQKRQIKVTRLIQDLYNLQSTRAQIKEKLNLKVEINSMREFGDCYRQSDKDIATKVAASRKYYIPPPMVSATVVKKWMQRISIVGLVVGIAANELWPKLQKYLNKE